MVYLARPFDEAMLESVARQESLPPKQVSQPTEPLENHPPLNPTDASQQSLSAQDDPAPVHYDTDFPEAYRSMVRPRVTGANLRAQFALFESEPRDEPWAQAMEAGMNTYLAAFGPDTGTVFEFVRCRSSLCVLAGYVVEGHKLQSSNMMGEMIKQGWWDGGHASQMTGRKVGEHDSFVIILPRYDR